MKHKLLTALLSIGLLPSLLFAQNYRLSVDAQDAGSQKVIDRVFTGNTVGLQVSFYDGADPLVVTNWTMRFMYGYGQYDTNGMVSIVGTNASSNVVVFSSQTNVFFSENGSYYFSIVGTNSAGRIRTFARGRMIEEYDPSTGGAGGYPLPMPWGAFEFVTQDWVEEYIRTNEFETEVGYGVSSNTAYRGDWGNSISNSVTNAVDAQARSTGATALATAQALAETKVGTNQWAADYATLLNTSLFAYAYAQGVYSQLVAHSDDQDAHGLDEVRTTANDAQAQSQTNTTIIATLTGRVGTVEGRFAGYVPTNLAVSIEEAVPIYPDGWGPPSYYTKYLGTNSWNFKSNGAVELGNVTISTDTNATSFLSSGNFNLAGDVRINGMRPMYGRQYGMMAFLFGIKLSTNFYVYPFEPNPIGDFAWVGSSVHISWTNLTTNAARFVFDATNSVLAATNSGSYIVSEIRVCFTNSANAMDGEFGLFKNGNLTQIITPPMDGSEVMYALDEYIYPGDNFEMKIVHELPGLPGIETGSPELVLPYGLYETIENTNAPIIIFPGQEEPAQETVYVGKFGGCGIELYGIADTNVYGLESDLRGQVVLADTPDEESAARQVATKEMVEAKAETARAWAERNIYQRDGETHLNDHALFFGDRWQMVETNELLQLYYDGDLVHEWVGGGAMTPRVKSHVLTTAAVEMVLSARIEGVYAIEWSTNGQENAWVRIETNGITQTAVDGKTVRLEATNPVPEAACVLFRAVSVVAATSAPKNRSIATLTHGYSNDNYATEGWVAEYVETNAGSGNASWPLTNSVDGGGHAISNATFSGTHSGDGSGLTNLPASGSGFPLTNDANAVFAITNATLMQAATGRFGVVFGDGSNLTNLPPGGASWSSFPASNNMNGARFAFTNSSLVQADTGRFAVVSGNGYQVTNLAGGTVQQDLTLLNDLVINGNLLVQGFSSNVNWTYVDNRTIVDSGTTHVAQVVYTTNYSSEVIITYETTHTTQHVDTIINAGGYIDAGAAAWSRFPMLLLSNGTATATGAWDFAGATLTGLPSQGITNIGAGLTGDGLSNSLSVAWGQAGTNELTNVNWSAMGDGGATNITGGSYDSATRTLTPAAETDPVFTNWRANDFTSAVDSRVTAIAVTGAVTSINALDGGVTIAGAGAISVANNSTSKVITVSASAVASQAEQTPLTYSYATNVQLVAGTNLFNQRVDLSGPCNFVMPTNAAVTNDVAIWLRILAVSNLTGISWTTNSPEVRGTVPLVNTNAGTFTSLSIVKHAGTNFFTIQRIYGQ